MLIKTFNYLSSTPPPDHLWLKAIRLTAWYQCFPSTWPLPWIVRAGLFLTLFIIAVLNTSSVPMKKGILSFTFSVVVMCLLGTVCADVYPIPFIIKLSFWRSTFIYLILALPCIAYMLLKLFDHTITKRFLVIAIMVLLTGYLKCFKLYYFPFLICFLLLALYEHRLATRFPFFRDKYPALFFTSLFLILAYQAMFDQGSLRLLLFFSFTILFLQITKFLETYFNQSAILQNPWVLPSLFILMFDFGVLYHKGGPEIYYHGRIQGKVDPWADIQMFANEHSHKDDLFITPPYLSGFGIYSMRATLGDWAEGGNVLYTDNQFAKECLSRMNDLGWKSLYGNLDGYNNLSTDEVLKAARKYGAKFVISEKPKTFDLEKIYENKKFILYKIS